MADKAAVVASRWHERAGTGRTDGSQRPTATFDLVQSAPDACWFTGSLDVGQTLRLYGTTSADGLGGGDLDRIVGEEVDVLDAMAGAVVGDDGQECDWSFENAHRRTSNCAARLMYLLIDPLRPFVKRDSIESDRDGRSCSKYSPTAFTSPQPVRWNCSPTRGP